MVRPPTCLDYFQIPGFFHDLPGPSDNSSETRLASNSRGTGHAMSDVQMHMTRDFRSNPASSMHQTFSPTPSILAVESGRSSVPPQTNLNHEQFQRTDEYVKGMPGNDFVSPRLYPRALQNHWFLALPGEETTPDYEMSDNLQGGGAVSAVPSEESHKTSGCHMDSFIDPRLCGSSLSVFTTSMTSAAPDGFPSGV